MACRRRPPPPLLWHQHLQPIARRIHCGFSGDISWIPLAAISHNTMLRVIENVETLSDYLYIKIRQQISVQAQRHRAHSTLCWAGREEPQLPRTTWALKKMEVDRCGTRLCKAWPYNKFNWGYRRGRFRRAMTDICDTHCHSPFQTL